MMPLPPADRTMGKDGLLTLHYLVIENIPVETTLEQATQLFDAPATVAKIKFIPGLRKLSSIGRSVQPALIAYYSEADAMRAAENLEGNDSLSRSEPLGVEYMGTDEEAKIIKSLLQRSKGADEHSVMLIGGIEEEDSYEMQH